MRRLLLAGAGVLLAAGFAVAQNTALAPSAAVSCLSPPTAERGAPEYPFEAFKQKLPGDVRVRLRFAGPAAAPAVTVLSQQGDDSFVDAVRTHVRTLRVPCHDGGAPVELDFAFAFRPEESPLAPVPVDPAQAERQRQLQCMQQTNGEALPGYPRRAQEAGVQGRLFVELRFEAPDQPPRVLVMPRVGGDAADKRRHDTQPFITPLRSWLAGYRMPCLSGAPVTVHQTYVYVFEGDAWGFKPGVGLRELLPLVRNIRLQRLQFDFNRMQCPFDLRVLYLQPNRANVVRQVGTPQPARQPFIEWLEQTQFDMPEKSLDSVYADELALTIPCLTLNLNPDKKD